MPQINPYLTFDGTCAEAMRFYERTLGGKLEALTTFGSSPMADQIPPEHGDRIMHARLNLDGQALMASDSFPGDPFEGFRGFSVVLNYPSVAEAKPVFDALAVGGKVTLPIEKTFWAEGFGMLVDRFGIPWMFNAGMPS